MYSATARRPSWVVSARNEASFSKTARDTRNGSGLLLPRRLRAPPALRDPGHPGPHGQARAVSGAPRGAPAAPDPTRDGGRPLAPADRRGHYPVPRVRRGPPAPFDGAHGRCRGRLPAGPSPGPHPRHLMSPLAAVRLRRVPRPRVPRGLGVVHSYPVPVRLASGPGPAGRRRSRARGAGPVPRPRPQSPSPGSRIAIQSP